MIKNLIIYIQDLQPVLERFYRCKRIKIFENLFVIKMFLYI